MHEILRKAKVILNMNRAQLPNLKITKVQNGNFNHRGAKLVKIEQNRIHNDCSKAQNRTDKQIQRRKQ